MTFRSFRMRLADFKFQTFCSAVADGCRNLPGRARRKRFLVEVKSPPVQLSFLDRSVPYVTEERSKAAPRVRTAASQFGADLLALFNPRRPWLTFLLFAYAFQWLFAIARLAL